MFRCQLTILNLLTRRHLRLVESQGICVDLLPIHPEAVMDTGDALPFPNLR